MTNLHDKYFQITSFLKGIDIRIYWLSTIAFQVRLTVLISIVFSKVLKNSSSKVASFYSGVYSAALYIFIGLYFEGIDPFILIGFVQLAGFSWFLSYFLIEFIRKRSLNQSLQRTR